STGVPLDDAIAEACALGIAESDPATDLDGVDAAAKLAIVCALAFGVRIVPSDIETRTTSRVSARDFATARLRGCTIRQIAHAAFDRDRGALEAWVAPTFVRQTSVFARCDGADNAVVIRCAYAGEITMAGRGAGADV